MSKLNSTLISSQNSTTQQRLRFAAAADTPELFDRLGTTAVGLTADLAEQSRDTYGENKVTHGKKVSLPRRIAGAFINPFTAILFCLAAVSAVTDIVLAGPGQANPTTVIIITIMVVFSGALRFVQETRSGHAAENLLKMITTTTNVRRQEAGNQEIPLEEVVVGDIVNIAAGDMAPADIRIIQAKDLFISQSALTGESEPVEKLAAPLP
ncbi:MAG: cation-transporting P-type ATPase, partial [Coriobacteriia bacterium]|nr:cation-transporting P-type ATPase [Coriobacteriia bacterium]